MAPATKARKSSTGRSKGNPSKKDSRGAGNNEAVLKKTRPEDKRFLTRNRDKLSPSTLRAKWLSSPDEHEDRPGQTLATRNHEVIQDWAEQRGGVPATVAGSRHGGHAGVLRFSFSGKRGQLQEISWDDWFKTFDKRKLVFLFQEHLKNGNESNFFRFDSPMREDG